MLTYERGVDISVASSIEHMNDMAIAPNRNMSRRVI